MSSKDERQVTVAGVTPVEAVDHLSSATGFDAAGIPGAIPDFKKVSLYGFKAEWALVGEDIQIKFFLPAHAKLDTPEARQAWMTYWLERFSNKLDVVARQYFEAEYPRLVVKWTVEFQSWWFRASSYSYLLDVGAYLSPFFEQLNQALQEKEGGS